MDANAIKTMASTGGRRPNLNEIASVYMDYFAYFTGIYPNPDKVLLRNHEGERYEIYEDLLIDPEVAMAMEQRTRGVICKEWTVIPVSEKQTDKEIAEFVTDNFKQINLDAIRVSLLMGLVTGFKPAEVMWDYDGDKVVIKKIIPRPCRRFSFDQDGNLRLLVRGNMITGEVLPNKKFIVFTRPSHDGAPYGDALGKILYWPVFFKKTIVKFWAAYCEKYSSPTLVGKFPTGTTEEVKNALLYALDAVQKEFCMVIPDNIIVEALQSKSGSSTTSDFESFLRYMDTAITKVILGQTLTSDQGGLTGSYALGKVHGGIRDEFIKSDADLISECFNQTIIPWMVDYNWPGITAYPKFYIKTEIKDNQQAKIARDKTLALEIGLPMSNKYFYDTYEVTPPKEGEELILPQAITNEQRQQQQQQNQPPVDGQQQQQPDNQTDNEQQTYSEPVTFSGQEALDKYIKGLSPKELQTQMNGVLTPIIDAVKNSETYTEIQEKLKKIYPKMDTLKFEGIIKTAMTTADLVGRTNAG